MAKPRNAHARRLVDTWKPVSEQERRRKNLQRSGIRPAEGWSGRFPTDHPLVRSGDVTENVRLSSIEDDRGNGCAIPTMINGVQLEGWAARKIAEENGLENYPRFPGGTKDAERFIAEQHGNFDERGRWTALDPPRRGVGQQVMKQMSMTDPNYGLLDEEGNPFLRGPFARGFMGGTAHLQRIAASGLEGLPLESGGLLKGARENLRARSGAVQDWHARTQPREGEYSIADHISEFGGTTVPTLAMYAATTATTGPIAGFAIPGLLDRDEGADLNWAEGGKGAVLGAAFRVVQPYNRAVSAAVVGLLESKLHPWETQSGKPPETAKEWISYLTGPGIMGIFAALGPAHKGGSVFGPAFTAAQLEGFRFNPNALKTHPSELSNMSRKDYKTHTDSLDVHAENIDRVLRKNPEFVEDHDFKKHMDLVIQRQIDARRFEEGNAGGPSGDGASEETDADGPSGPPDAPGSAGRRSPEGEQPGSQEPSPPATPSVMELVSEGELRDLELRKIAESDPEYRGEPPRFEPTERDIGDLELRKEAESDPTFFNQERRRARDESGVETAKQSQDRALEVRDLANNLKTIIENDGGREIRGNGKYPHFEAVGAVGKKRRDGETWVTSDLWDALFPWLDGPAAGSPFRKAIRVFDASPHPRTGKRMDRRKSEESEGPTEWDEIGEDGWLEVHSGNEVFVYDLREREGQDRFTDALEKESRQGGEVDELAKFEMMEEAASLSDRALEAGVKDIYDSPHSPIELAEILVSHEKGKAVERAEQTPRRVGSEPNELFVELTTKETHTKGSYDTNVAGETDLAHLEAVRWNPVDKQGVGLFRVFDADGSPVDVWVPLGGAKGRVPNRKFELPMEEAAQRAAESAYENRPPPVAFSEKPAASSDFKVNRKDNGWYEVDYEGRHFEIESTDRLEQEGPKAWQVVEQEWSVLDFKHAPNMTPSAGWYTPAGAGGGYHGHHRTLGEAKESVKSIVATDKAKEQLAERPVAEPTEAADFDISDYTPDAEAPVRITGDDIPRDLPVREGTKDTPQPIEIEGYHGGKEKIAEFDAEKVGSTDPGFMGSGVYFYLDPALASQHGPGITSRTIRLEKPLDFEKLNDAVLARKAARRAYEEMPQDPATMDAVDLIRAVKNPSAFIGRNPGEYLEKGRRLDAYEEELRIRRELSDAPDPPPKKDFNPNRAYPPRKQREGFPEAESLYDRAAEIYNKSEAHAAEFWESWEKSQGMLDQPRHWYVRRDAMGKVMDELGFDGAFVRKGYTQEFPNAEVLVKDPKSLTDRPPASPSEAPSEAPVPGRRKILVSCTGAKCPVAEGKTVAAEDLYTGDAVKDAKRASKKADAEIGVIISAKHGVLDPKQQVKPYDQKLPKSEKEALKIVSGEEQLNKFVDLMKRGGIPEEVYLHGSKMYRLLFNDLIERAMDKQLLPQIRVVEPKHKDKNARHAGVAPGIGEQKAQLKAWSESDPGVQFRPIGTEFSGEGTGKFETVRNDAGKEFRITSKDSLGDQVLYHGGEPGIKVFDSKFGKIDALFGRGVYLTDSRTVAESYANKIKGGGEVYPVRIQAREILDFDNPIPNEAINVIYREAHEEFRPMIREEARKEDATGSSIWERLTKEVEADSRENRKPDYEYEDMFNDIEEGLVREGWDAITHVGGNRAGKGKELHRVVIALDPTDWGGWRGTEGLMPQNATLGKSGTSVHKVEEGPGRAEAAPTPPPEAQAAEPPRPPPTEAGAEGPPEAPPPPPPPPPPGGTPPPGEPPGKPPGGAGGEARSAAEELLIEQQATDMVDLDQAGVAEAMNIPQPAVEALERLEIAGEMSIGSNRPAPETLEQLVSLGLMDAEGNLTSRGEIALRARQKKFEAGKEIIHSGQQLDMGLQGEFVQLGRLQTIENTIRPTGNWREFGDEDMDHFGTDDADNMSRDDFERSSKFAQQERKAFDDKRAGKFTRDMRSEWEKKLSRPLRKEMQNVLIQVIKDNGFVYEEGGRSLRSQFTELLRSGLLPDGTLREIANRHGWTTQDMLQIWGLDSSEAGKTLQELKVIADYMKKEGIKVAEEGGELKGEDVGVDPGSIGTRANRYIMNLENVRRGLLVSQISTMMRNMETQLVNQGIHSFEARLDHVIKYMFDNAGMSEFAAKIQPARAGEAFANSMDNLITGTMSLGTKQGKSMQKTQEYLSRFPKEYAEMFSTYMSDISDHPEMMTPALIRMQKVANLFNTFNRWQEFSIRSGVFNAELGRLVELDGKFAEKMEVEPGTVTLQWLENNNRLGQIPRKHVKSAVQKSLEATWAADFKSPRPGRPGYKWTGKTLEWLRLGPTTIAIPFPRFMANSIKWQLERNPLSVLRYMSKNQRQAFMDGDVSGISKWITGNILFGIAYALRDSDYAGSSWEKAKAGETPAAVLGIEEGAEISFLPYSPMAGMLFWAEYLKQGADEGIYAMSLSDIVKALTSSQLRAGLGLHALDSYITDTATRHGDMDKVLAGAGEALGVYAQGFLTPLKQMSDVAKAMDKDLDKVRMVSGNDFAGNLWGSATRNIPWAVENYPEQETLLPIGIPPEERSVSTYAPGLKLLTGILASEPLNALQEQAKEVDFTANEMIQGSGNRKWDNLLKEYATRHLIPLARVMQKNGEWFDGIKWNDMSRPARHAEIKNQLRKSVETARLEAMDTHPDLYAEMMEGREPKRTRELRESIEEHRQNAPPVEEYRPSFYDLTDEQIEALR